MKRQRQESLGLRLGRSVGRAMRRSSLVRFHRDQQGAMLEYAMIFGLFAVFLFLPVWPMDGKHRSIPGLLFDVLSDYFGMIAFYVGWPFL